MAGWFRFLGRKAWKGDLTHLPIVLQSLEPIQDGCQMGHKWPIQEWVKGSIAWSFQYRQGLVHPQNVQLRIAKILEAEKVEKADKLLKLKISLGDEERTIIAGIAEHYKPEDIVGKQIAVVANLEPAKIRGIESNGMLLAATHSEGKLALLTPDKEIGDGAKIR